MTPVSCTGKNPFGTTTYRRIVRTSVTTVTTSVPNWWRRTQRSVLSYRPATASNAPSANR
jgi:hypothetical protein